ncbi:dihydrolipoyllysine-residue acetyltransferase [Deinococcus sp. YIM 77859]|uniref:dihydrolipoyllysine-residue acetyltransferase n=1 Tax=Deinococcus sp. YIM 77859 TaxID=1540221 RepID=UPI000551C10F|nr:dihydrolipoyllysine-residue acetyltransferase [Deinococcus sp. YIM 77859]
MATELKLPDVGDNIEQGTVVTVLVGPGDVIAAGQPIIEIETDKAVVEVPATQGGTVQSVNVNVGDTVKVGGTLLTLAEGGEAGSVPQAPAPSLPSAEPDLANVALDANTANRVAQAQQAAQKEQAASGPQPTVSPSAPTAVGGQAGSRQVTLPDVGDNIEQGTVVNVLVRPGDVIAEGQPVIEIETDKAVVEVPANASGTVQDVAVKVGDSLKVGGVILTLGGEGGQPQASSTAPAQKTQEAQTSGAFVPTAPTQVPGAQRPYDTQTFDGRPVIPAAPSVRRLARELHVDIQTVHGTGIAGRISEEDVRRAAGTPSVQAPSAPQPAVAVSGQAAPAPLPDFAKWGPVRREDMSGIRRATVRSMTQSWTTIPMVTHFDKADVTRMEEVRKQFAARVERAGGKLTMTHILMKVVANALRKFPKFGASLDLEHQQVIYKDYVNLGVAVDTPQGLLVPVLKDADRKSITEIVLELSELASKARERKLSPAEMQGATFTISNLGGIGGTGFTPIVNAPEVAILGVSRGGFEPVWNRETGSFEPRNMLPLSLTYDHRLIDGADAARFLRFICETLEDPFLIVL